MTENVKDTLIQKVDVRSACTALVGLLPASMPCQPQQLHLWTGLLCLAAVRQLGQLDEHLVWPALVDSCGHQKLRLWSHRPPLIEHQADFGCLLLLSRAA